MKDKKNGSRHPHSLSRSVQAREFQTEQHITHQQFSISPFLSLPEALKKASKRRNTRRREEEEDFPFSFS